MNEPDTNLFYFDAKQAERRIKFIEKHLVYPQSGPCFEVGQPFKLTPFQTPHIRYIFGWHRHDDHSRMVRETFWFLPKKNGKTALGAVMALCQLFLDEGPNETIVSIANSTKQASICFDMAKNMILQSPTLGEMVDSKEIIILKRSIEIPSTGRRYEVVPSSIRSIHGPHLTGIYMDELHAAASREVYDAVQGAGRSSKSPLKNYMTTAGFDRTHVCYEVYEYATKIRDGIIENPQFYPVIYEAPKDADWKLESTWRAANPNFELMNRVEWDNEFRQAVEMPASENKFKRLNLNIWTSQSSRWMPFEVWDKCRTDTPHSQLIEQCKGKRAFGGLDVAPVNDTSSLTLMIPTDDDKFIVLCWVWIPTDNATMREKKDRVPYSTWIREGFVFTTPGETTDYDDLYSQVKAVLDQFQIVEIGYDNAFIGPLQQWLSDDGYLMVQISQSYDSMSPAFGRLENWIKSQKLIVPKHPALDWMVGNAEAKSDSGGRRILDKSAHINRIDAVAALAIATKRAMVEAPQQTVSVYETRTPVII